MSTVLATITYAASAPTFPAGTSVASIVATITGAAAGNTTPITQTVAAAAPSITFDNVIADSYTYSVAAVDSKGAVLGTAVTGSFTVSAPATISLSLPSTVAISVA